jgi:hypothetical protein
MRPVPIPSKEQQTTWIDPAALDRIVNGWLRSHLKDLNLAALAVDGKCVRTAAKINGQAIQLFGALDAQSRGINEKVRTSMKCPG